jgi:hypothetical protein
MADAVSGAGEVSGEERTSAAARRACVRSVLMLGAGMGYGWLRRPGGLPLHAPLLPGLPAWATWAMLLPVLEFGCVVMAGLVAVRGLISLAWGMARSRGVWP